MVNLERASREDLLRSRLVNTINNLGDYQIVTLIDVNEGAFAAILDNGKCIGPFAFFTGDPVPLKEDLSIGINFLGLNLDFRLIIIALF